MKLDVECHVETKTSGQHQMECCLVGLDLPN
jgi:hypothetical protein